MKFKNNEMLISGVMWKRTVQTHDVNCVRMCGTRDTFLERCLTAEPLAVLEQQLSSPMHAKVFRPTMILVGSRADKYL